MRLISTYNLKPGMVIAKAVYNANGQLLLNKDVVLTEQYIKRLKEVGITDVYIEDDLSRDVVIKDVISDETRLNAKIFVKNTMERISMNKHVDTSQAKAIVESIIDELLERSEMLVNLQDIRAKDEYTFSHCVNVCVLSLMLGLALGYDRIKLSELGTGALLHDIGKVCISDCILKKPSKLTPAEFDEIKRHTIYGYQMLKESGEISGYSCYIALCHHERPDGKGYPLGLKGDNIHQFAKIAAICDVYDALTSNRVYRRKMKIPDAVEYLRSMSMSQFDYDLVNTFLRFIALYPVGSGVILNTGQKGIVVRNNPDMQDRPVVRVIDENEEGKYEEIDLMEHLSLFIVDTYEV
ncbi:HD-GYP domain-containing protein [Caldanaerobius polysaccharolyticus]|uniref:HD-GYP domain-containing protein n=1 Tax=Caldanaerobius polysaccharolyticus TaxID=44256 RepID=UPI00047940F8|nr:HD-GYP domain-containing protein [Caldanaerobius polysaccharolyticus]